MHFIYFGLRDKTANPTYGEIRGAASFKGRLCNEISASICCRGFVLFYSGDREAATFVCIGGSGGCFAELSLSNMTKIKGDVDEQKVFRDVIKKHRGDYYVEYHPAIWCRPIATVNLTFPNSVVNVETVRQAMERELEYWLHEYPVPVMVTAWDVKEDMVQVSSNDDEMNLFGYVNQHTGQIVKFLGLANGSELPKDQMSENYFSLIYKELPYRRQADVKEKAIREAVNSGRVIRLIVFLVVGVPLLIQIVSLGVDWIGYVLSGISIIVGLYKLSKAMGWIRPSKREILEAEKKNKMGHYYYHCEKNSEAFNRLKFENFEREAVTRTQREAETILGSDKGPGSN